MGGSVYGRDLCEEGEGESGEEGGVSYWRFRVEEGLWGFEGRREGGGCGLGEGGVNGGGGSVDSTLTSKSMMFGCLYIPSVVEILRGIQHERELYMNFEVISVSTFPKHRMA